MTTKDLHDVISVLNELASACISAAQLFHLVLAKEKGEELEPVPSPEVIEKAKEEVEEELKEEAKEEAVPEKASAPIPEAPKAEVKKEPEMKRFYERHEKYRARKEKRAHEPVKGYRIKG